MINAIGIALGGLAAAAGKVQNSAVKIANVQTPGIGENVDMAAELVNLKIGETEFKANLATIRTAAAMSDELFRIFDKKV